MSPLSRKIAAALDAAAAAAAAAGPLVAGDGARELHLALTAASPVGVAFDRLDYALIGAPERSIAELRAWGDRLAKRLTYLMETLVVLEVDAHGGRVELRSGTPTARQGKRTYYELHLRRDATLTLDRVAFDEDARRRDKVACQLTREALERLVDDLVELSD